LHKDFPKIADLGKFSLVKKVFLTKLNVKVEKKAFILLEEN
jgi:hypothetical protein